MPEVVVVDGLNVATRVSKHRTQALRQVEFRDERDGRLIKSSFSTHERGKYYSPRHRHNFDQVRYLVAGRVKYGPIECREGDCTYFPEGVFYGPTEIVSDQAVTVTLQTQGPSWGTFPSLAEVDAAVAAVSQAAEVDPARGVVTWPGGRRQDSFEAALEQIVGSKLEYPEARYQAPCVLRSEAFPWMAGPEAGLSVKMLASFNESGPAIGLRRLEAGATLPAGAAAGHQLITVLAGRVRYGDHPCERGAYLYYPPDVPHAAIVADDEALLLAVELQPRAVAVAATR